MLITIVLLLAIAAAVGSFLTTLVYRLPLMIKISWQRDYALMLNRPTQLLLRPFNLCMPRSHCPFCKRNLNLSDKIPLLSFLWLKGKCAQCKQAISLRYFLIESLSVFLSLLLFWQFGLSYTFIIYLFFTWALIAISFIDLEHFIIPDGLNYYLLWMGLAYSLTPWSTHLNPSEAIIGAITAYTFFAIAAYLFKFISKKEGLGQGDVKLLAAIGAWLGAPMLIPVILGASLMALPFALLYARKKPLAFGPFLAASAWIVLCFYSAIEKFLFI